MKPHFVPTTLATLALLTVTAALARQEAVPATSAPAQAPAPVQEAAKPAGQTPPTTAPTTPEAGTPTPGTPATKPTGSQAKPTATKGGGKTKAAAKPAKPKPPKPVWQEFKLDPKATLFLDFTDANADMILSIFSRTSGITILKAPAFKEKLTVTSAKAVRLDEAFQILDTVLGLYGYQFQKKGNLLLVNKIPPPQPPPPPPSGPPPPDPDKMALKVYHLSYANAQTVAKVVNEVFSQQQLEQMIQTLQQGGGFSMGPMYGQQGQKQPKVVRASSDDYSNSVVVNAPEKYMPDVEKLINELDKSTEAPLESRIFQLKFINVDEVVDAIQNVLKANAPVGRGAPKQQDSQPNYYDFYSYRRQNNSSSGQTAVAIRPTNSVIVSATKENMKTVENLITSLDKETPYTGTTFVVHLENAKATDVATLLNSAFTKRRDNNNDDPFFFFFSDFGSDQKKSDVVMDLNEDGQMMNIRDLTGKVNVMADANTNSLIVVTLPSNMRIIRPIIEQIDKIAPQVMIETVIVEANLDKTTKLGVEWNFLKGRGIGSTNYTLQTAKDPLEGLKYTLSGSDYKVFLNALQTDTRFKVLSTPRIFTSNNVKAEINVSQQVPYITAQQSTATTGLISNYDFKNVGVVLTVTPRITAAGEVSMEVVQSADDLQGFTTYNAPIINHRQASTTASVKDGETIVVGGIIRKTTNLTENKIPLLGDIPLLGHLFKSTSRTNGQTELMVLLTPHIVRTPEEARRLREEEEKRLSKGSNEAIKDILNKPAP